MKKIFLIAGVASLVLLAAQYFVLAVFNEPTAAPPEGNVPPPVINRFSNCRGGCYNDPVTGLRWDSVNRAATNWSNAHKICQQHSARLPGIGELVYRNISDGNQRWADSVTFERTESGFFGGRREANFWGFIITGSAIGVTHVEDNYPFRCVSGL